MKYRNVEIGELILVGDEAHNGDGHWRRVSGAIGEIRQSGHYVMRRPVKEHNWISFKDRKPTEEDAAEVCADIHDIGLAVAVLDNEGSVKFRSLTYLKTFGGYDYWMPLSFVKGEPPRIKVRNEKVIPNKDGSVKVGCTTIPADDMKEIVRQYTQATKE